MILLDEKFIEIFKMNVNEIYKNIRIMFFIKSVFEIILLIL